AELARRLQEGRDAQPVGPLLPAVPHEGPLRRAGPRLRPAAAALAPARRPGALPQPLRQLRRPVVGEPAGDRPALAAEGHRAGAAPGPPDPDRAVPAHLRGG